MEPGYFSAFAALAGSAIGGLTSLTASWLGQHVQFKTQRLERNVIRRQDLYRDFIEEASKWYAHAYEHDEDPQVSNLVGLYALVSRMRVISSQGTVDSADEVVRAIIDGYLAPKRSFGDVKRLLDKDAMNPLRDFSAACREELREHL